MKPISSLPSLLAHAPMGKLLPAGLAALLSSLCSILLLGTSAYLIASAALHPPLYTLALAITLVRACGIGRAAFRYLDRWLSHRAVFHAQEKLRLCLYEKASALLPLREAGVRQGEFLHNLAKGCDALRDFYLKSLTPPALTLLLCLMGTAILLPVVGSAALLLPLLWLLHLLLPGLLDKTSDTAPAAIPYRDLLADLEEGRRELQSSGSLSVAVEKLHSAARKFARFQENASRRRDRVDTLLLLLDDLLLLALLFRLSLSVLAGSLTGVELAVYLLALQAILAEFASLPEALRNGRDAMKAARSILGAPNAPLPSPAKEPKRAVLRDDGSPPLLSVQDISFSYLPGLPVLKNISFSLHSGEKLALIGESGSGKTTLACLLMGLWQPESGQILRNGTAYSQLSPDEIRSTFAPCLQGERLFSASLRENFLRIHPDIREEELWRALDTAQLKDVVLSLPQGLDTPLGEDGCHLSGGEGKRLLVALALASPAPVLLLDEPTAGLDKKTARALMEGILSHLEGRSLLIITHDMLLAHRMDHIYAMPS